MAMPNWSIKAEYLYYDLGNASATAVNVLYPSAGRGLNTEIQNVSNFSTRFNGNIVRAGVNYHFNWGTAPVVAKY
jgi:outer membrane immunogenic protein